MLILSPGWVTFGLLLASPLFAGETLRQMQERQRTEYQETLDRYEVQTHSLKKAYSDAYAKYLRGKGPYPSEQSKKFGDVQRLQSEELRELSDRQTAEREDRAARKPSGSHSSAVSEGPAGAPGAALDGSQFPKELSFPAKK